MKSDAFQYEKVTKDNLEEILRLQHIIFPDPKDDARWCYTKCAEGHPNYEYYAVVLPAGTRIGVTGIYRLADSKDKDSEWLGWFGVLPEYRRKKYGTQIVEAFLERVRKDGYAHARLYTSLNNNDRAISFYRSLGLEEEVYDAYPSPDSRNEPLLIFSKSMTDSPVVKWNNRAHNFL